MNKDSVSEDKVEFDAEIRCAELQEQLERLHALFAAHVHAEDGSVAHRYAPYASGGD